MGTSMQRVDLGEYGALSLRQSCAEAVAGHLQVVRDVVGVIKQADVIRRFVLAREDVYVDSGIIPSAFTRHIPSGPKSLEDATNRARNNAETLRNLSADLDSGNVSRMRKRLSREYGAALAAAPVLGDATDHGAMFRRVRDYVVPSRKSDDKPTEPTKSDGSEPTKSDAPTEPTTGNAHGVVSFRVTREGSDAVTEAAALFPEVGVVLGQLAAHAGAGRDEATEAWNVLEPFLADVAEASKVIRRKAAPAA